MACTWPENKYCAFDIDLWGSFHKVEAVKKSLLAAVGSSLQSSSSFRAVTTGMCGIKTFKDDYKSRGPQFTQECDEPEEDNEELSPTIADVLLEESINSLLLDNELAVAVFCGPDMPCFSTEVVAKHGSV